MDQKTLERLVVERDLHDSRVLSFTCPDGTLLEFQISTLSADAKREILTRLDKEFPIPPTVVIPIPNMPGAVRFDLEDTEYLKKLDAWHQRLAHELLGASAGLTGEEIQDLPQILPAEFIHQLHKTIELINGIQSEPLMDLIRDAMYAPEVLTWTETYKPKAGGCVITDTPLFREFEAMVECGLRLDEWKKLLPREKVLYMTFHESRKFREAYANWFSMEKSQSPNMR